MVPAVGEGAELGLPGLEVVEGVADEGGLACFHQFGDVSLGVAEGVGAELVEEGLESELQQGAVVVGANPPSPTILI
jgi:hypothetical protein